MKINVITIPEEGLGVKFSLTGSMLDGLISAAGPGSLPGAFILQKVEVAGSIKKYRQSLAFTGHLETLLSTACARCLEEALLPVQTDFSYTLLPVSGPGQNEVELQTEDLEIVYYEGEIIDLAPLMAEQVILQIPMRVLCRESCQGLCPRCGANLNEGACDCPQEVIDPRWAGLKNIKLA
jgi:uncharacterized protein